MENNNNQDPKKNQNRRSVVICLVVALVIFLMFSFMNSQVEKASNKEITYDQFLNMLDNGQVSKVVITSDEIKITPAQQANNIYKVTYYTGVISMDYNLINRLEKANVEFSKEVSSGSSSLMYMLITTFLPILLLWGGLFFVVRMMSKNSGGMMGVGKSTAKMYVQKATGVTFKDVAGQEEAMESLNELVDFLNNPGKYTEIGAKLPKGALLVGPPGTGKTLLAKAVAGEAGVPFFSLSGSDFVEMFVGVGASRVRDLFKQAQSMAPCIIFIDEIDAIGKSRDSQYGGGNDEREQTLNQLLSEMDGFDSSKGLVILGATNRPEVLDKALLRPGRFDRRIIVEKPDLKGRVDILKVHAKDVLMDDSVDFDAIALATSGAVGSDLANMINEGAIMAVRAGRKAVSQADLFEAVEVVIAGKEKKDRILGKEEKRIVAYHEVGHALVTALQKNAEPVQKITIVPRTMGSLGYVMQVPEEEKYLMSKDEILTRIVTLFGGRAAEQVVFNSITTGASNDIEKATSLARAMVTQYGMTDKFGMIGLESVQNKYLDGRTVLNCGDATEAEIDQEVMRILKECYAKAEELLRGDRDALDKLAEFLIEHETITGKEFMKIFRKVKGIEEPEGDLYDAIVIDVDGTLLDSDKQISEKTVDAIVDAQKRGKKVAIASGRSIAGIRKNASKIQLEKFGGYVIAYNGTTVVNCKTGECIYNQMVPGELLGQVYNEAVKSGVSIAVYNDAAKELIAGNGLNRYVELDAAACDVAVREVNDFVKAVNFGFNKILLSGEPDNMKKVENHMAEMFGDKVNVFRSDPHFVELLPKYVDKGVAVEKLMRYLDINRDKVICVGDSINDMPMLRYAGMGVAMGNAQDKVKQSADYVTLSHNEDGVANVINKFMKPASVKKDNEEDEKGSTDNKTESTEAQTAEMQNRKKENIETKNTETENMEEENKTVTLSKENVEKDTSKTTSDNETQDSDEI
ncbi:ATP-dependent zinc metalloprotease FtsH [Eubacterium sp. MSJ-13]|uniref:ATP-dependent zinc metalloprotease FtsH n=1 Tax=Eubacterium sp. MSJ-13 TaxID=2841513 RepID=UPI001C124927|nr:ATP-dependent zinc metalloprotease FtsH [Eubacterium sp. MSJ-13]MBU5478673.1 ATP-dependent zinc metalloprotease FtsH [Eubacterium sp. MSJ-13]